MKKQEVNAISAQWVAQASKDVRDKIKSFAESCGIEPLAMHSYFDLTKDELYEILNEEKVPSLELFSKIMVLTDNTIMIVPINEAENETSPFPHSEKKHEDVADSPYSAMRSDFPPTRGHHMPNFRHMPPPPPMPFMRRIPVGDGNMRHTPNEWSSHSSDGVDYCEPFRNMTRSRLIDIICKKHWDSEIDLVSSTFEDLVKFLGKKNEGIIKNRKVEKAESGNPELMKFVDSLKQLTKNNPQVKELVKGLVMDL